MITLTNTFDVQQLTSALNLFPVQWGRLNQLGLFAVRGVANRTVIIDEMTGVLSILPTNAWGGAGTKGTKLTRNARSIIIPQTVHEDIVLPEDVVDQRAFGSDTGLETVNAEFARRLMRMRAKHDITLEFRRMSALQGIVYDADGTSPLLNLHSTFGTTLITVNLALSSATTDVVGIVNDAISGKMSEIVLGTTYERVHVFLAPDYFKALIGHDRVREAYRGWQEAQTRIGGDMRNGFSIGAVTFEEYRGFATDSTGANRKFLADSTGVAFPVGAQDSFYTYVAPADFNETVNTVGQLMYAKQMERPMGRGWEIHTQCNALPVCLRPNICFKLTMS